MDRRNLFLALCAFLLAALVVCAMVAYGQAFQPLIGQALYLHGHTQAITRCSLPDGWTCYGEFTPTTFLLMNDPPPACPNPPPKTCTTPCAPNCLPRFIWHQHSTGPVYGPETVNVAGVQKAIDKGCGGILTLGLPPGYQVQPWDPWDLAYVACGSTSCYDAWIAGCQGADPQPNPSPTPVPTPHPSPTPQPTATPPVVQPSPSPCPTASPCPSCPSYTHERIPLDVRATLKAGVNALGKKWAQSVVVARAWIAAHQGGWYVPSDRSTGQTGQGVSTP
jgi:hypothetical protein